MTHQYELMVILTPELDERQVAPNLDKFLKVITNDGGSIDKVDIWGKRRFAYEINKKNEGIYAVVNFTATSEATVLAGWSWLQIRMLGVTPTMLMGTKSFSASYDSFTPMAGASAWLLIWAMSSVLPSAGCLLT